VVEFPSVIEGNLEFMWVLEEGATMAGRRFDKHYQVQDMAGWVQFLRSGNDMNLSLDFPS
jgi:hypothetical protein